MDLKLYLLGPGDGFNVLNLIDCHGPYDLQIRTLGEVGVLSAQVEHWSSWMDELSVLLQSMATVAAARIESLCQLASDPGFGDGFREERLLTGSLH